MFTHKRIVGILLILLGSSNASSQNPPNFIVSMSNGVTWELYDALDSGKVVLLDFFFTDCQPCKKYTPQVEQLHLDLGVDSSVLTVVGISDRDDDVAIKAFNKELDVTYLTCGVDGGGDTVTLLYQSYFNFLGWPTYAVICPDTTINWNVQKSDGLSEIRRRISSCKQKLAVKGQDARASVNIYYSDNNDVVITANENNCRFIIADVQGKTILSFENKAINESFTLNHEEFVSGLYVLKVQSNSGFYQTKLIMQ